MSFRTTIKLITLGVIAGVDYFVMQAYQSIQTLANTQSSLLQLKNTDAAYVASNTLKMKGYIFYTAFIVINIIMLCVLFGSSIKNKIDEK